MSDSFGVWLAGCPGLGGDPMPGMLQAGLLQPAPDYMTIARTKAALVERTGRLGIASMWGGPQLVGRHFLRFGTAEQQAEWLGRALAVAISEPRAGAHPKLLTTRAEPVSAGFRITGEKAWVSNGPSADAIIVFAITTEDAGRKRYSAFIVPRGTPGLTFAEMPEFHALRPAKHCSLTLAGCQVPENALLGEAGSAYERMALPFRDIEDAVGTFATLGAIRRAVSFCAAATPEALGAIVALTAVFADAAEAVVATLDAGRLRPGNATLVGLRVLAIDIAARIRSLQVDAAEQSMSATDGLSEILADLDASLNIARGARLARQLQLGEAAQRAAKASA